ncbi:MAG TPA: O-antigen ligase family protein [Vicinamibacterales bacterium]|nr:O-antigen ligase family protein [Vicinamibacterales bacterium]
MPLLERTSKTAASTSVLLILALMLAVHPDVTWLLRALTIVALAGGWVMADKVPHWLLVASIAPAFLRLLAGREGPVLDLVWMAGLAGGLLRAGSWSRWAMPFPWNVLIGGWTLALSLAWPVLVAREVGFRLHGFFDTGAVNSGSLMSAPYAASWTLYVVLAQLIGALWFEWAREKAAVVQSPIVLNGLWAGATAASVVAVLQGTLDIGLLSTEFWAARLRATGTMLDANSYGVCAALAAPIGFLGMRALAPHRPAAAIAVFAVNFAGMWLSGSRTAALVCGLVGTGALFIGLWRERRSAPSSSSSPLGLWIAGGLAVLAVVLIAGTASPIRRALDIPPGRAGLMSLWDRGGYGPIALRMTREYPLTGVGAGSYRALAPDYHRAMANDALPLDNAQNWWRHQIAELGVFGGALVIAFSVLVGWRVITGREAGRDVAAASTVRGLLLGLGIVSLFGMPTQNPLVLYWLLALMAWFAQLVPDPPRRNEARGESRVAWIVASSLAVAYAGGHLVLAVGPLHPAQRAKDANRDYVVGAYPPEPLPESNEFRWTSGDARFIWAAKTRYMAIRLWAHHPDISSRPVHVTMTSTCGLLFDEDLTSDASMSLGMMLPEGQRTLEATVRVSRTWSPSDAGEPDDRQLGVGIVADFSKDPAFATNQLRVVKLSGCAGGI